MLADISNFFICQSCNDQSLLEEHNYPFNVNTVATFLSNTLTVLFAKSIVHSWKQLPSQLLLHGIFAQ